MSGDHFYRDSSSELDDFLVVRVVSTMAHHIISGSFHILKNVRCRRSRRDLRKSEQNPPVLAQYPTIPRPPLFQLFYLPLRSFRLLVKTHLRQQFCRDTLASRGPNNSGTGLNCSFQGCFSVLCRVASMEVVEESRNPLVEGF